MNLGARMNRLCRSILILAVALLAASRASAIENLPPQFVAETVLSGLAAPVNLETLPDGRMFVVEKGGRVLIFNPSVVPAQTSIVLGIGSIQTAGERGLASVAVDPDFLSNGYFYAYYTELGNDNRNRISRFTFDFNSELASGEILVWEDNEAVNDCCHFGGALDFGPDGMLYLATGEEFDGPQAQDLTRAGGKIIRLNTSNLNSDGPWVRGGANEHIIPDDNPPEFQDGTGPMLDEIWAYGLRNPFRGHWDLVNQRYYLGEVGGNVQTTATEDLHVGRAGANFGWPLCEGDCGDPLYDEPVYAYGHTGASPAGGAIVAGFVYRGDLFPESYDEVFFLADYALGYIKYLVLDDDGEVVSVEDFATDVGPVVALELGPDGAMYTVNFVSGEVVRYTFDSGNQRPVVESTAASVTSGPPPLDVTFSATASDPEGDALEFTWFFGDGNTAVGPTVTYTYTERGFFNASVVVSDADGSRSSELIPIQVGTPPIAVIESPVDMATFRAGDTIQFQGRNDGLSGSEPFTFDWDIKFFHNAHVHPALIATGESGEYFIPRSGHDYHDDTGYEFQLTVTDADGLSSTTTVRTRPEKVDINLSTVPAGFPITVDGLPIATPIAYDTIIDFEHVVAVADSICTAGGVEYEFASWSNGGNRIQALTVAEESSQLIATFNEVGACLDIPLDGLVARFEADVGVETAGNVNADGGDPVVAWRDLSGLGNDLVDVSGDPSLQPNAFNERAVIDFDGFGDMLSISGGYDDFPFGSSDRTVFLVASYESHGPGGFAYGRATRNQLFGLHLDDQGDFRINGFGPGNDFVSDRSGMDAGWVIQSATVADDLLTHSINGEIIDVQNHTFDTRFGPVVLGADSDGDPTIDMQVAAIFVYDRALNEEEQELLLSYLDEKYFTINGNRVPMANNDSIGVGNGGSVTFDVVANDIDDGGVDPTTVTIVREPASGTVAVDSVTGLVTYTHNGLNLTDSFRYTVEDVTGIVSNEAVVEVSLNAPGDLLTDGLVLRLEADSGVSLAGDLVTGWEDTSGNGNDLTSLGDITLVPGVLGDMPALVLDGNGDRLQRIGDINGLPEGGFERTMFFLVNYEGPGYGGFTYGQAAPNQAFGLVVDNEDTGHLSLQAWGLGNDFPTIFDGNEGWVVQSAVVSAGLFRHFENGTLIDIRAHEFETVATRILLGAEIDGDPSVPMEVGAVLVYDRALSPEEQTRVQNYLQVKYDVSRTNDLPPFAAEDRLTLESGTSSTIDVLANDFDFANGELDEQSITIVDQPQNGIVTIDSITGALTYSHSGVGDSDLFTYTVLDNAGQASNPAEVLIRIGTPVDLPTERIWQSGSPEPAIWSWSHGRWRV